MNSYKVIIVDDEKPARDLIRAFLSDYDNFEIISEAENGFQGCLVINENKPDLVFLDVQMPKINGIEMLELLEEPFPFLIFSTAYDDYAVKAFENNALDYLLKPYSRERFKKAINKFLEQKESQSASGIKRIFDNADTYNQNLTRIPVKYGSKILIILIDEIMYFEAQNDYVKIVTESGKYLKQNTMKYFEERLSKDVFVRIHRSFILNINCLKQLETYDNYNYKAILKNNTELDVSRSGSQTLKKLLNLN